MHCMHCLKHCIFPSSLANSPPPPGMCACPILLQDSRTGPRTHSRHPPVSTSLFLTPLPARLPTPFLSLFTNQPLPVPVPIPAIIAAHVTRKFPVSVPTCSRACPSPRSHPRPHLRPRPCSRHCARLHPRPRPRPVHVQTHVRVPTPPPPPLPAGSATDRSYARLRLRPPGCARPPCCSFCTMSSCVITFFSSSTSPTYSS